MNKIAIMDVAKCQYFQFVYNSDKNCFEYYCSAKLGLCTGNCSFVREQKYKRVLKEIKEYCLEWYQSKTILEKIDEVLNNAD